MALLTTHSETNKVRQSLPVTTVTRRLILVGKKAGSESDWAVWSVRTTTTERFSYVGMTETAAGACVTAMLTAYTHAVTGEVQADIEAVHVGGLMWQVNVESRLETTTTVSEELV